MRDTQPKTKFLKDYRAPDFLLDQVDLHFDVGLQTTTVTSQLALRRVGAAGCDLHLDGEALELVAIQVDGRDWSDYAAHPAGLTVRGLPDAVTLAITVQIHPQDNTALEGLYACGPYLVTQCEAHGFRRITYFPDRPDVLARYRVTIDADAQRFPTLLSNGDCVESRALDDGRHRAVWVDPHPKPSYLFALVAGEFEQLDGRYTTASGREVSLELYGDRGQGDRLAFALESLKQSMAWDEQAYGREYDLDRYMIVAAAAFNMGAMENKGLNVFNTSCLLATPDTATDAGHRVVRDVIAHEYFHNWTGNRITCRDWFQLSLKEGLTVFREQQFSETVNDPAVARVEQVRGLRATQFPEDAGPMAHPVRPESYVEMNNFYTPTVYEKGAEVIRMMRTLVGAEGFRQGMDIYFDRHDGQAVTIEDFVAAIEAGSGEDLTDFRIWYAQAGTPKLTATDTWDADTGTYSLTLHQQVPPTAGQPDKRPAPVPVALAVFNQDGTALETAPDTQLRRTADDVWLLDQAQGVLRWDGLSSRPVVSLLRGFSAPVRLDFEQADADLATLMRAETDAFARWESGQRLLHAAVHDHVAGNIDRGAARLAAFCDAVAATNPSAPIVGEWLDTPRTEELADGFDTVLPDALVAAHDWMVQTIAESLAEHLPTWLAACRPQAPYQFEAADAHTRRRRAGILRLLSRVQPDDAISAAETLMSQADNLTDRLAALAAVNDLDSPQRAAMFDAFAEHWSGEDLIMDKWFALQAVSTVAGQPEGIADLIERADYDRGVPNRVRAVFGQFGRSNFAGLHRSDGAGYQVLADEVIRMDARNPQVAARLVRPLIAFERFDEPAAQRMRAQVQRIADTDGLSDDVGEIVGAALGRH